MVFAERELVVAVGAHDDGGPRIALVAVAAREFEGAVAGVAWAICPDIRIIAAVTAGPVASVVAVGAG